MITEKLQRSDLSTAKHAVKDIEKFTKNIEVEESENHSVCIRPIRELWDLERKHYRRHGYGIEAKRAFLIRTSPTIARSAGSIALFYGSAGFLENHSHRFITGEEGTSYHREAFNIDSQAIGSRCIELASIEEIAEHKIALPELVWLSSELQTLQHSNWAPSNQGFVSCRV